MALRSDNYRLAKIVSRTDHGPDFWTVRVDPGDEYHFVAGQYAAIGVAADQRLIERPYSIVSSPYEPQLEFFLELVPNGELTPRLHRLFPGDAFTVRRAAKGRFTLDTSSGHSRHLLLCTVTGVAPFVSYTRTLFTDWKNGQFKGEHHLYLIQGASHTREFGYRTEIEGIAGEVPWLTYVPTISRPWENPEWDGETGRVDDILRKYADRWELDSGTTTAYLCGQPQMVKHCKAILHRHGWDKETLKEEVYFGREAVA